MNFPQKRLEKFIIFKPSLDNSRFTKCAVPCFWQIFASAYCRANLNFLKHLFLKTKNTLSSTFISFLYYVQTQRTTIASWLN